MLLFTAVLEDFLHIFKRFLPGSEDAVGLMDILVHGWVVLYMFGGFYILWTYFM